MTGLTQDSPSSGPYVRAIGDEGICVGDHWYGSSLLLSEETVDGEWPPQTLDELQDHHFEALFALNPEVVLLGLGRKQQVLHPTRLAEFYRRGVGIEVMTTEAACRTFNLLASDGRKVVAALMPLNPPGGESIAEGNL